MHFRSSLATMAGRAAGVVSRATRRGGGTAVRGLAALTVDPDYAVRALSDLDRLVYVTGTNGKTTTTALLAAALRAAGRAVLTNPTGSNLERGLASTVTVQARWNGRIPHAARTDGVFELDEWAFAALAPRRSPDVVVLLNVFRDQLDRYGELDRTAQAWRDVMRGLPRAATVIANADDPLVVDVAGVHRGRVRFFGLDVGPLRADLDDWADARRCPRCDARLFYDRVAYSHLGHYRCPRGDLARPALDLRIRAFEPHGLTGSHLGVTAGAAVAELDTPLPGLYSAYNIGAALATVAELGVPLEAAAQSLATVAPVFGRAEVITTPQAAVWVLLVKNPAGANQTLDTLALEPERLDTLILLNDGVADGEDVSWVWDVDFERLRPRRLTVGGRRAEDLALRLKYAGVVPVVGDVRVVPGIAAALDAALVDAAGRLAVLTTYTAMLALRAEAVRRGWAAPYWADGP